MTSDGLEQGISSLVYQVLQETSQHAMPRQRLQRVVLAAMAELAHDFDPFKDLLRAQQGVPLLLSFLSPKHDEYLIKETLQLLGRMTQSSTGIQQELQRYEAINAYSGLACKCSPRRPIHFPTGTRRSAPIRGFSSRKCTTVRSPSSRHSRSSISSPRCSTLIVDCLLIALGLPSDCHLIAIWPLACRCRRY